MIGMERDLDSYTDEEVQAMEDATMLDLALLWAESNIKGDEPVLIPTYVLLPDKIVGRFSEVAKKVSSMGQDGQKQLAGFLGYLIGEGIRQNAISLKKDRVRFQKAINSIFGRGND